MWTSLQPFVLPLLIKNFEDPKKRNKSIDVQEKSTLLDDINLTIKADSENPITKSIYEKYLEVERKMSDKETGERTIELYKRLSSEEVSYLKEKGFIESRKADGVPFAVKTIYYNSLRK